MINDIGILPEPTPLPTDTDMDARIQDLRGGRTDIQLLPHLLIIADLLQRLALHTQCAHISEINVGENTLLKDLC